MHSSQRRQLLLLTTGWIIFSMSMAVHANDRLRTSTSIPSHPRSLASSSQTAHTCMHNVHTAPVPNYTWFSKQNTRQASQVYLGNRERLRAAMERYSQMKDGDSFTVVFLGGSITSGQGASDGKAFPWWAEEVLHKAMGPQVHVRNGAVPGTLSSYMSVCHNVHVPKEADVIIVDYSVNDDSSTIPAMDNAVRRPFERLLRKLLNYPRRPAVILIHAYCWHRLPAMGPSGLYYKMSSEREFHNFAMYYGLPELSVKGGAWPLMHKGVEGFMVNRTRGDHVGRMQHEVDHELKGKVFYWDIVHPDGQTGHRFMGEITAQALLDAWADVIANPVTEEDRQAASEPLPPPMLHGNWESSTDKCFIGPSLRSTVIEDSGWEYKDEGHEGRPKLGYISDTPGKVLRMKVNTTSAVEKGVLVTLELSFLKSYVNMGQASVSCTSGCTCDTTIIDGHHEDRNSQLYLHEWQASQHDECVVTVEVLPSTSGASGHHKVKIAGIMISEVGGKGGGVKNWAAVQMVAEGASTASSKPGTFDVRDWLG